MNTFSTQLSYTPTLSAANLQLLRLQLQNVINNFSEILSAFNIISSKRAVNNNNKNDNNNNKKLHEALIDIYENEHKYVIDRVLIPLIHELKVHLNKNETSLSSSFYFNRFGFTEEELLKAQFNSNNSVARNHKSNTLFNNSNLFKKQSMNVLFSSQRGFKTQRTQIKETENPSMMNKLLSLTKGSDQSFKELNEIFKNPLAKKKLTELIDNKTEQILVTGKESKQASDEANKLKIAFAEGYLAYENVAAKKQQDKNSLLKSFRVFLFLTIIGYLLYINLKASDTTGTQNGNGIKFRLSMGNNVNEIKPEDVNVKFSDVRGVHEAKEELEEIVDYLKEPEKFTRLGARLPKGVLLVGGPGVGKTLLAKAVAGEAGVPFFHANGSEFDEMFVGTGARKMRSLFQAARQRAPCVIFIDEIDSVGAKRTNSPVHPYANQTINQILAEMDGFEKNEGIIVLAATNRPEQLDPALKRPGRFDVEISIEVPDVKGRMDILELYLSKIIKGDDIDINKIARKTTGFTGAELENLVNQAALKAALENKDEVTMKDILWGYDKIAMGPEKLSKIPDEETNRTTAYHEAGHTIVAYFTKDAIPLHKVTIIPRGRALGYTSMIPNEKDQYGTTKNQLLARIDVSMGGRVAEELIFGNENVTTGASSDLEKATRLAERMVKTFGMSDKAGFRVIETRSNGLNEVEESLSQQTQELIDQEIRRILQESYDRAKNLLKTHMNELKTLSETLLIHETLDIEEIKTVIEGNKLPPKVNVRDQTNVNRNPSKSSNNTTPNNLKNNNKNVVV